MPTAAAISSTATSAFSVGVGVATAANILPASSLLGPIGLAVGLVATLVLSLFGGGCGQTCIAGSKVEQIFEAFADNLLTLVKAGMMSKAQGLVGMNEAIQIGQQSEAQLGTQAAQAGSKNLTKVISAEIADLSQVPDSVPQIP
ncbi:MAG TPA: hypothetical protein VGS20_00025, partial [Candidatus Acidoferrales bacterium]|nr:hypothetical protein [Candidatus Acidoferrales bacterium]